MIFTARDRERMTAIGTALGDTAKALDDHVKTCGRIQGAVVLCMVAVLGFLAKIAFHL